MQYASGRDFRQALEGRLRKAERERRIPLVRLRKQVAFERFLARLTAHSPTWVLKGGLAIQLRLGNQSRTTLDIDLLKFKQTNRILEALQEAANLDLKDWFSFEVENPGIIVPDVYSGQRFHITCLLDGRTFEEFKVDVGVGDPIIGELDFLTFDPVLDFADIEPTQVPCYPITQQIAEKLHALTRTYQSGASTRAKDIVDILLLAKFNQINGKRLLEAVQATFRKRNTHTIPKELPIFSTRLAPTYARLARELGLEYVQLNEAEKALYTFISPILMQDAPGEWNPENWGWK